MRSRSSTVAHKGGHVHWELRSSRTQEEHSGRTESARIEERSSIALATYAAMVGIGAVVLAFVVGSTAERLYGNHGWIRLLQATVLVTVGVGAGLKTNSVFNRISRRRRQNHRS
jgi:hypothetical protein